MISSTNMAALYSANAANKWSAAATTASERISTTYRINRSSDDPSGMMMATTLSAELSSYSRTLDNIHSGIAAIQNVDASLTTIASYLTEMRTLAVTAASTTDATTLSTLQTSFDNYRTDITDVATYTTLNGSSLMDGSTTSVSVQVGIAAGDSRSLSFSSATAATLGLSALDISTSASTAIDTIDTALVTIGNYQSLVGAHEKLMDYRETLSDNMIFDQRVWQCDGRRCGGRDHQFGHLSNSSRSGRSRLGAVQHHHQRDGGLSVEGGHQLMSGLR